MKLDESENEIENQANAFDVKSFASDPKSFGIKVFSQSVSVEHIACPIIIKLTWHE